MNRLKMRLLTCLLLVVPLVVAEVASAQAVIGDRLVIAINNIPYSQRQVETYIAVKESLRRLPRGEAVRLVVAGNWVEAVKVFGNDMLILQEAIRLGSFQSTDQNFDKYERVVRERFREDLGLKTAAARLGIDELTIAKTLETVLRIASFRRSKDRQAAAASRDEVKDEDFDTPTAVKAPARWFLDLEERAVTREYQNAKQYIVIQPTAGAGH